MASASRGLGLEFTRQLLQSPHNTVFATCRSPSTAPLLTAVANSPEKKGTVHVLQLDQNSEESVLEAAKKVGEILGEAGRIDYILNNAGTVSHLRILHDRSVFFVLTMSDHLLTYLSKELLRGR